MVIVVPSGFCGDIMSLNFIGDGLRDALDPKDRHAQASVGSIELRTAAFNVKQ
ncbi:hypothetical protein DJICPGNB_04085 [Escherichia coli]|nr:hypothetical protein DJICPGNB_04085 [Escherichia coli]